ncbi:hypothetical protein CEV32_2217 [Brucella rhizosphaerae]|uniref:Uncharacterized protein n=1 Tax=Brucella rhizosphaerae TaxID=571254 RepID=A0A256F501_9HYPH|nr:hypothetical protein CEV32_2217 [Brucella rhizosphaerae]
MFSRITPHKTAWHFCWECSEALSIRLNPVSAPIVRFSASLV